jgi:pimeloyl-ACP methyl ester carboxylesterase
VSAGRWAGLACGAALLAVACTGPTSPGSTPGSTPGSSPDNTAVGLPPGAAPVLFVHGYGTDAAVFDGMVAHLEERGYPASYLKAVELDPNDGANIDAATRELAPAVEELVAATGGGPTAKIDIVAHSMGALSSRWYAAKLRPERVRTLLTVVGANHGTDELCGHDTGGSADLCPAFADDPAKAVQVGLNGTRDKPADETPYGLAPDRPGVRSVPADDTRAIRYVAVSIPDDQWIRPVASSALSGASPVPALPTGAKVTQTTPGNLMFGDPTDHDRILDDERFFVVLDALLFGSGGV